MPIPMNNGLLIPLEKGGFCFNGHNLPILAKSLQLHNSPVNYDRDLFKPLKDSAIFLVCNETKKIVFFVGYFVSVIGLGLFDQGY